MTTIYLLRHGETAFNAAGRYQGRIDSPLTPRGQRQAEHAARLLATVGPAGPVAEIRVSPLGRAWATARIVAAHLGDPPVVEDPRLIEISMGRWDGLTRAGIEAACPSVRRRHPGQRWMFEAPEGERLAGVVLRVSEALAAAAARPGPVVLVGHGIAGRLMRGLHRGLTPEAALLLEMRQGEVYRLDEGGAEEALSGGGALP